MGGIMTPITMGRGFREARQDNRRDEMLEMEKQNSELRRKGLDLQLQEGQMRMDETKANQPLVKMQRDAAMVSHIATFGLSNLGDGKTNGVSDEDLPAFAAKLFTDMPMGGQVRVENGQIVGEGKPVPVSREWLGHKLTMLAKPEMALKMKMDEYTPRSYADAQGNVSTMTPAEAKSKGGFTQVEDMKAGLDIKKGLVEDKYAERKEQGALNLQTAQINSANRANQREPKEPKMAQFVDPATKQVVTMPVEEGQKRGLTLHGDYAATQKLQGGEEGSHFSETSPQSAWDAGKKQAMTLLGYVTADTNVWGEPIAWAQLGPGGEKLTGPVDHSAANRITNDAFDLVANKKPVVFPDGSTRVISTVTEAVQILADAHLRKKARYAKETADAKKAATEAMNATNR